MENLGTPSRKPPAFRRPAILLDDAEKHSDSSSSDAPDGVHFRKPMAPVQMTISPGNAANEGKLADKLKKLELSRKKTTRTQPIDLKTPSKIDLVATERFFVESSVENIAQTPRNQSIREPFRNPQLTHDVSLMDTPRDSMRSNATYILTTPRIDRALHPHNDPFTPAISTPRKQTTVTTPLAYDEKLERQFVALSSWANVILDSASFVSEIDLGTSKQDASRKLQEMLTKPSKKNVVSNEGTKGRYTDLCLRRKCLDYLKRADSVYQSIIIPGKLKAMVEKGEISIKPNIDVYANIGVQTSILSLLFSLHPFWLFIGVETVCAEFSDHDTASLDARLPFSSSSFAPATVRFIHDNILANANLMSKKKFAIGTVKKLVTDKGREVLHKHCITCILSMAVLLEYAKNSYLFENTPGLFVKNSEIKTVTDFCTELSRLVLSASGTPLNKAFDKSLFRRTYRQSFLEEYQYVMKSMRDMADGILLGRLIELLTDSPPLSIIGNMRNPQGDRIRKKGNVEKALSAAAEAGIDVDGISIDQILAAHRESCLDLMWRLVGVYVKKKAEQEPLRRESLCLEGGTDTEDADDTVMGAPLGGMAESAFVVYQQLAFQFGLHLSKWADLEDGLLLSSIWQHYNSTAPDVRFYDGDSLFDKVANAAESDLGIPLALTALRDERQLGLFAHMFLSRLISYKRLMDSEMSDAESDASSIVSIIRKEGANLSEETERIQRVRLESERVVSAREEEERVKKEEEKRREDELRKRFEEEEEERLASEWRSPPRSSESIEREEKMLMEKGEEERIEEEMRMAEEKQREEEAQIESERLKREEEERMREEEECRRKEEEEIERVRKEREEEEERVRREEEDRLEEERKSKEEEEERERMRLIEEARVKAEEEEGKRKEEEEERRRVIEEARLKVEEEERKRREEEEELRLRAIEEARLRAEDEERQRIEKEEEERRKRAALTIQCWTRGVNAVRLMNGLRTQRKERLLREEEEKREKAAIKITSWICDRLKIRSAMRELEERRMKREEEERENDRLRLEEEWRRKKAVERIEMWFSSLLSIRAARSLLQQLRDQRRRREEEERVERERLEAEEREREEERRLYILKETAACMIQNHYRGWRKIVEAKEELERRRKERRLREEEERLERERLAREEEERLEKEEEERLRREEEEKLKREEEEERIRREEEKRLKREDEERLIREEEERMIREEESRLERERQEREEEEKKERVKREEAARLEMEVKRKEEERRREEEELREWAAKQRQAREREERIYQEMEAAHELKRRVEEMRENRAARVIQSSMRSWLQKKKTERRTMELLRSINGTPRVGRNQRMTIGGVSDDRLMAGVREIKRRQRKLSLTLYRMSSISKGTAATRIQAWWRGVLTRRRERVKIELIGVRMKEYNQQADRAMEGDTVERSIPVSKRLEKTRNSLQNPQRLYDIKVACYTTMSLCRLSSLYCERAIVLDLPSLLINMFTVQADRSPAFEEIIEFGVQAIEEMIKCTIPRVRGEMVEEGGDVVRISSHWMLAFPNNSCIPTRAMKILRMCKEILPEETHSEVFAKMHSYYLKKGEDKFGKLPSNDVRNKEFLLLKKAFSK